MVNASLNREGREEYEVLKVFLAFLADFAVKNGFGWSSPTDC